MATTIQEKCGHQRILVKPILRPSLHKKNLFVVKNRIMNI